MLFLRSSVVIVSENVAEIFRSDCRHSIMRSGFFGSFWAVSAEESVCVSGASSEANAVNGAIASVNKKEAVKRILFMRENWVFF